MGNFLNSASCKGGYSPLLRDRFSAVFRLLDFIRSTYVAILFILAETIAISHYASTSSYSRAKVLASSNAVIGSGQRAIRNTVHLFGLSAENRRLSEYIATLEMEIDNFEAQQSDILPDDVTLFNNPEYTYIVARAISNSINKEDNFIVLDKGIEDGVRENMAVITPNGELLGYITGCSSRFSATLSALSYSFKSSGKLLDGEHFGSISWSGDSRYELTMSELSKYATINVGDTIVSTGFSQIFPPGVNIGRVKRFELNQMQTAYNVAVELSADITAVDYVLIVGRRDSMEIEELINDINSQY